MYSVYFYKDGRGNYPVQELIKELNKKSQAKIAQYIELLKEHGPNLLRPYADQVKDKILELRIKTTDGNVRVFYFFFVEHKIILLHAFKKKTQELPEREIEQAKRNMEDFIERYHQGEFKF